MSSAPSFAVDAHVLTGRPQGTRTVLLTLLRAIADLGEACRFVLYAHDVAAARRVIDRPGFAYRPIPAGSAAMRLLVHLPAMLARDRPAAALFQYIAPPTWRGRSVVAVHDILPLTHPWLFPRGFQLRSRVLFTMSIARARRVIAVSEFTQAALAARFPACTGKLRLVVNGPSFPLAAYAAPPAPATGERIVLAVGRLERRKNMPLLARAFVRAAVPDLRLVIVGRGERGHSCDLPQHPAIEVRADDDDDELIALYRRAALFVMPSSAEGFGLPLLDATLFGVPAIAARCCALPEVGGRGCRYFDPDAPDAEGVLAGVIRGHSGDSPIVPPAAWPAQQMARFDPAKSARALIRSLEEAAA